MVKHALDAKDKLARRGSILDAASRLFLLAPDKLPSAAMIAEAAGLAKGTVYLYFSTKEAIFMALLQQERAAVLQTIADAFGADGRPADQQIAGFIGAYCDYVLAHPQMLKLDALGYSVLERNVDAALLVECKLALLTALTRVGGLLDATLSLPDGRGMRALVHTYALTCGLWQSLDYPEHCRDMLRTPGLEALQMDFRAELHTALSAYWRGLLDGAS
jgi:TetR/AcrR family transcriptional regulator